MEKGGEKKIIMFLDHGFIQQILCLWHRIYLSLQVDKYLFDFYFTSKVDKCIFNENVDFKLEGWRIKFDLCSAYYFIDIRY